MHTPRLNLYRHTNRTSNLLRLHLRWTCLQPLAQRRHYLDAWPLSSRPFLERSTHCSTITLTSLIWTLPTQNRFSAISLIAWTLELQTTNRLLQANTLTKPTLQHRKSHMLRLPASHYEASYRHTTARTHPNKTGTNCTYNTTHLIEKWKESMRNIYISLTVLTYLPENIWFGVDMPGRAWWSRTLRCRRLLGIRLRR